MKNIGILGLVCMFLVPLYAHGETVLRIGENIAVDADQVVEGDYYVSVGPFGNTNMSGSVTQDMYAFGGSVTVNGSVGSDLTIVGGNTNMHATVTDDVRIVSGQVTIAEYVGGDLFVLGGVLTVLSGAVIEGDVIFFGGEAEINGSVGGSVLGTSEKIRIDAEVEGDVDIKTATTLTLGEKARVSGKVNYTSPQPLIRAQNAVVEGEITSHTYTETKNDDVYKDALIPVFVTLFAALTLFLLFRKELHQLIVVVHSHPVKSSVYGFAVLVLAPVVSLLLIATLLGSLVGIAGLAMFVSIAVVGIALSGVVFGALLSKLFTKKLNVSLLWIIIGTASLHALLLIPVLGVLLVLGIFILTVGGITLSLYRLVA